MAIIYIILGACIGFCAAALLKTGDKRTGHKPGKESEWNRGYSRSPCRWR